MRYVLIALALAGCATKPDAGVRVEYQTVTKEIQRPCAVTRPVRPAKLPTALPADATQLLALVAAKLAEYAAPGRYADQMDAALAICTKP